MQYIVDGTQRYFISKWKVLEFSSVGTDVLQQSTIRFSFLFRPIEDIDNGLYSFWGEYGFLDESEGHVNAW